MSADFYPAAVEKEGAEKPAATPIIAVCFHMAGSSRGEYRAIAPELVKLGCSVLAVDLRSGEGHFLVENQTAASAREKTGKDASYADAYPDIGQAILWARELAPKSKVVVIGSSYSASLVLVQAAREPRSVDMVLSFSPGEYIEGWSIAGEAKKITVPVYITCGKGEREKNQAQPIAEAIDAKLVTLFLPGDDVAAAHGSRTLLVESEKDRALQWEKVKAMLARLKT